MATADLLLEMMFSWIEQRKLCAEQLKKLARELESLREKSTGGQCVGNSVSVVGAACLIGAGVATLFTGGAAAPLLGGLGAVYSGVGVTISVAAKIIEGFISSDTMKDAKKIEEKNNKITEKIQNLFEQLKAEVKKAGSVIDPDEVEKHVMTELLRAVARRSGLKQQIDISMLDDGPQFHFAGSRNMKLNKTFRPELIVGLAGILTFFTFKVSGKNSKLVFAEGSRQLAKKLSSAGVKTALKGGAMVVGGTVGMAFALPEAIDNWKDLIENNHVTEASQSLRDTADDILNICRTLKTQIDEIKKVFDELADVKRCIENSNRSSEERRKLIEFAKKQCEDEEVRNWLTENSESMVFFELVDMFNFLRLELEKKKKTTDCEDIDIIFVAHGAIEASMIPASCLCPLSSIKDVLLYSPWNCVITADVAYGVATGRIRPWHRIFGCGGNCHIPDERHQPTNLPNHWNSMREASGQRIPNIIVSPLGEKDGAWERFLFLQGEFGEPRRNRVVIPFILPGRIGTSLRVPFAVITLALSLVLFFFGFKATVHLTACLGKISANTILNKFYLNLQYSCTIDQTAMTTSREMLLNRNTDLYRAFKAVFG